jgi:outer membrane protein TolC
MALRLVELVEARVAALAATAIDANLARLDLASTELALADARLAANEARRTLATLLAFDSWPPAVALTDALPGDDTSLPELERLQAVAFEHRLDLRAARSAVEEATWSLDRQRGQVMGAVDAGAVAEKEGDWSVGPGLRLELPIFDQNHAQVARAQAVVAQREHRLASVRLAAIEDVGSAVARTRASWGAARIYEEQILTRSEATLDLARAAYQAGISTLVPVLQAQRGLLEARRDHVLRLRQAAAAVSDLERATGTTRENWLDRSPREERRSP